ncbi:unnamed protein product, partial [Prorocentrum cordatum]
ASSAAMADVARATSTISSGGLVRVPTSSSGLGGLDQGPHVMLLQERRLKGPNRLLSAKRSAAQVGLNPVMRAAESTGQEALQSSSCVAVFGSLPMAEGQPAFGMSLPSSRCQVAVVNSGLGVPLYFASVYQTAKTGQAGPNITFLADLLAGLAGLTIPRVGGGDWKLETSEVQEWARTAHGVVVVPAAPTRGPRVCDFSVCSRVLPGCPEDAGVISGSLICARVPVRLRWQGLHSQTE